MRQWQYLEDGELRGPVEERDLESMVASGSLAPDTMVWAEGAQGWATVTDVLRPDSVASLPSNGSFSRGALAACAAGMAAVMAVPLTLPLGIVGLLLGLRSIREIDVSQFSLQPLRGRGVAIAASVLCGVETVVFVLIIVRLS